MAVHLFHLSATCAECGFKTHQIDADKEHAVEAVTAAMEAHIETEHPDRRNQGA